MDYHTLEKMTVNNLREEAKKHGAKGVTGMKKDELIALLAEKLNIEVPKKSEMKKGKAHTPLDKKTLKKKIAELRELRTTARSNNDKKNVALLRRRIHRLKRQMRLLV